MKNTICFLFITLFSLIIACKKEKNIDNDTPIVQEDYLLGLNPSNQDSILLVPIADTALLFNRRIASLPDKYELDMPPIKSQGSEGSCVAFALAYAARSFHLHRDENSSYFNTGNNLNHNKIFSPEYLYNIAKQPGDCATAGMNLYNALDYLKGLGVATWQSMPYSSTNGCATLPNNLQTYNASLYKIDNFYRITDISAQNIKEYIYVGYPIVFGAIVDSLFWRKGNFVWNSRTGKDMGGHAMVICGWDDAKHAYKIMNSWDISWGDNGFGWIDYDYLDNVLLGYPSSYEMFVMQTSLPQNNFNITLSNSSLYPSIAEPKQNLCKMFVTCDFKCSINNWNQTKKIPTFVDANGQRKEINGVLEYDITSNWGAPNKWIHAGKPVFSGNDTVNVVEFYNININRGLVTGKVKIYGDVGMCDPTTYNDGIMTSFKYSLINTSLNNVGFSSDTIGTYTTGSNFLSTYQ
jgi:hypothetical protein